MKKIVTASIVLYNNDTNILLKAIESILNSSYFESKLYLIDNSPIDSLKNISNDSRVLYFHNPSNPGFGSSHNFAITKAIEIGADYHFVVNPDIYFNNNVIVQMVEFMSQDDSIGMLMPQIRHPDGKIQYLPKLLPSPWHMVWRKIGKSQNLFQKFINLYELRNIDDSQIYNVPIISGCFTLLNLKAIEEIGMYDDKFFMYFEDWDLSRRIHKRYKTLYFPLVNVCHEYESGANKNIKLFLIFVKSAIYY